MKVLWIIGCVTVVVDNVDHAVNGNGVLGADTWARGLDVFTAIVFVVGAITAFRTHANWFIIE